MPLNRLLSFNLAARMLCTLTAVAALCTATVGMAQTSKTEPAEAKAAGGNAQPSPAWAALKPLQRQALAPLAATWDSLSAGQQRKWLEVSRNYPALTPVDQAKMHGRMSEWVALSARERSAARLNFAATSEIAKELSPQEKKAKWDAYQALSADERKKLADQGSRPPLGAAPATRPVATQKLAILPGAGNTTNSATSTRAPKMLADPKPEAANSAQITPSAAPDAASTAAAPVDRTERAER